MTIILRITLFQEFTVCLTILSLGSEVYLKNTRFGEGSGPIFLSKLRCTGQETSLLGCQHNYFHHLYCDHDYDAGVKCEGIHFKHYHVN